MKLIPLLLLICSTASAQTYRAATTTNTAAPMAYTVTGVDTAKRNIRSEIAALRTEIIRNVVTLRPGTVDSLNRLSVLLTDLSTRIAQQGASLSTLNATVAGNVAGDNAQAVQISSLVKQIGSYDTLLPIIQAAVKTAQDAAGAAQGTVDNLRNYLKATP